MRAWEFEWNDDTNVFSREPLHNWASHPADGFAYGCQVMREVKREEPVIEIVPRGVTVGMNTVSLDELWKSESKKTTRL